MCELVNFVKQIWGIRRKICFVMGFGVEGEKKGFYKTKYPPIPPFFRSRSSQVHGRLKID